MNRIPVEAVVRRELEEAVTDWRLLVPLLVLTCIVPFGMLVSVLFVVRYLSPVATGAPLVPMALLLCGFLPAGFCLVSASESFVGEKERNTLEALLATPMTDGELYLGKLIAAFVPPGLSAGIAMGTFTGLFMLLVPPASAYLPWTLLVVITITVAGMALIMVTGALIISIQATTIRAANLVASFLLVPMTIIVELEALLMTRGRTSLLIAVPVVLFVVVFVLARLGLATFNRETILSREHRGIRLRQPR